MVWRIRLSGRVLEDLLSLVGLEGASVTAWSVLRWPKARNASISAAGKASATLAFMGRPYVRERFPASGQSPLPAQESYGREGPGATGLGSAARWRFSPEKPFCTTRE
jgi:hypothetical protein